MRLRCSTGLSPWTWRDWTNDRKVDSFKLGTRVLIPQEEIDRVLSEGFRPRLPKVRRRAHHRKAVA